MMSHRVVTPGHTRSHQVTTNRNNISASVYASASVYVLGHEECNVGTRTLAPHAHNLAQSASNLAFGYGQWSGYTTKAKRTKFGLSRRNGGGVQ